MSKNNNNAPIVTDIKYDNLKDMINDTFLADDIEKSFDIFWELLSFSKEKITDNRENNKTSYFSDFKKINNSRFRCTFTINTSKFVFNRKSYHCTFDKDFNYLEINGIIFHKLKYKGIFNVWFDIDNRINSILGKTFFYLNGRYKKFKYDNFHTHIANVFYMKLFNNNIEEENSFDCKTIFNSFPITDENKHFIKIKNNGEDRIIMDSLLFYESERVYCIFEKDKNRTNKYKLVQLATRKKVIYDLKFTRNTQNLISNNTPLPNRTIKYDIDSFFINKDNPASFGNIVELKKHLFTDHWDDRLKKIFETYKKYNGIDKSIPLTADQIKNLFKAGLINKIKEEVDNNVKKETYISGDELYIYIDNKNTDRYFPKLKKCFFLPIDFCGKIYYVVVSINTKNNNKSFWFNYETLYTEEMRNNQIMPYESIKNKISQ